MERKTSLFGPLALIAIGVLWLLISAGKVPGANLWALVQLWPFLLIAAGLSLILRGYWKYAPAAVDVLLVGGAFLGVVFAHQLGWDRVPGYMSFPFEGLGPTVRGSGHVVTETRPVQDVALVSISYPAEVIIRQGEAESLTIEAEDNVGPDITTNVVAGRLTIERKQGAPVHVLNSRPVRITLVVKGLDELDFESAGSVRLEGLTADHLTVRMDGAGGLKLSQLQVKTLDVVVNGVGNFEADGSADALTLRMDGLGSFNAGDLHVKTANVNLDGLGNVTLWVDDDLTADMNGLGNLSYYGGAVLHKSGDGLGNVQSLGGK
jgi:putative autotransporter adhesin-like protein